MNRRALLVTTAVALAALLAYTLLNPPADNEANSGIQSAVTSTEGEKGPGIAPGKADPLLQKHMEEASYPGMGKPTAPPAKTGKAESKPAPEQPAPSKPQ